MKLKRISVICIVMLLMSLMASTVSAQDTKRGAMDITSQITQESVQIFIRATDGTWEETITDDNGQLLDPSAPYTIETGEKLNFKVNWSISDIQSKGLVNGDWFELNLPSNYFEFAGIPTTSLDAPNAVTGVLETIGTFELIVAQNGDPAKIRVVLNELGVSKSFINDGYVKAIGRAYTEKAGSDEMRIGSVVVAPIEIITKIVHEFPDFAALRKSGWQTTNKNLVTWRFNVNYDVLKPVYNGGLVNPD